jgi:DNA gyrase subunit A
VIREKASSRNTHYASRFKLSTQSLSLSKSNAPMELESNGTAADRIIPINIEEEMKSSYIDYSMSVIVNRALPDARDGLKPVHRRVLYGMDDLGLDHNSAHKKSARIVGEVLGKYHPHGDSAVYDTMVRMAQPWSMRGKLVDGQGNFGSVDGDSPAAMRYTEARMEELAEEMLADLGKDTVDFRENFDGSLEEPVVLPSAFPNLLVNGGDGIAVGMATKIPPHNLGEVIDATIAYIDDNEIDVDGLLEHLPGPDFPTGGIIHGHSGVREAYETGRGRVVMRAKMHEEELPNGRRALIITEIPFQVNKSALIEKVAHAARGEKIEGVHHLRDESDREGMRIVVELKRDAVSLVVQNLLYKHSYCQRTFGVNMVALVNGRPKVLSLKDAIRHYVNHRHEVVVRRTEYDLRKAEDRAHVLEGLKRALDHIDAVIAIIRHSGDTGAARSNLMNGQYPEALSDEDLDEMGLPTEPPAALDVDRDAAGELLENGEADLNTEADGWLSERQAQAILDLRLNRLTGLEREKILDEYRDIIETIEDLRGILASEDRRFQIIKDELREVKEKYADERRTEIDYTGGGDINMEDLVEDEQVAVTVTHQGLIKRTPATEYRQQGRGGVGMRGSGKRDDDYIEHLFVSSNHDWLLFFTDHGQCYWLRVFDIPEGSRTARGRSIRNLIQIAPDDRLQAVLAVSKEDFEDEEFLNNHYVTMATRQGQVKKSRLEAFSRPRVDGIIGIDVTEGDELLEAELTSGDDHVVIASSSGHAVRFPEDKVRSTGRDTRGVRGIRLAEGNEVVGMFTVSADETERCVLTISANGYGKCSDLSEYPVHGRGGKGVITLDKTARTGRLVAIKGVRKDDDLMIITENGIMIRSSVGEVSTMGRNTQGVRLIDLKESDAIADVTRLVIEDEAEELPEDGEAAQQPEAA